MTNIDVAGLVLRVRRSCDLSQRELADVVGLSQSQVARVESGSRSVDVMTFEKMLSLAGMRIVVVDADDVEAEPVSSDAVRDHAGRRLPAHLDVRPPFDPPRAALVDGYRQRPTPKAWYHHRVQRDRRRGELGLGPGDDQPTRGEIAQIERDLLATRLEAARRQAPARLDDDCTCLPVCWEHAGCAPSCACRCES
ncbi:helix-turn-helix transcriptional regulator [Agromyces neolithicus]|uniref:HTH cro/C1-type domain-containing protein n=1 Tax=Agromyces neolithicus TaxID=269420 RepID=A0ABN2M5D0_9MICO